MNRLILILLMYTTTTFSCAQDSYFVPENEYRINLHPDQITILNGRGRSSTLIDEPYMVLDNNRIQLTPKTEVETGFRPYHFPSDILIAFEKKLKITHVALYLQFDVLKNVDSIELHMGNPFSNEHIITLGDDLINGWNLIPVNTRHDNFLLRISGESIKLYEAHFYSDQKYDFGKSDIKVDPKRIYIDKMIGVNGFVDDPPGLFNAVSWVREYHNWYWTDLNQDSLIYPNNRYRFNPAIGFNFDLYYKNMVLNNVDPVPCVKLTLPHLRPKKWLVAAKPVSENESSLLPSSYAAHSEHLFNYLYRYGNGDSLNYKVRLEERQPYYESLGLINYIENWNEPDIWWKGNMSFFHPFEYAAMSSYDYDAHQQKLIGYGIKNADRDSKLVMAGTAGLHLEYLKSIKVWSDHYRDKDLPLDVINFHFGAREVNGEYKKAIMPEDFRLSERLDEIVAYRDRNLPNKEIWLSEFGYDQHPESIQGLRKSPYYSTEEAQAIGIIRHYLLISGENVNRASMYMLRDAGSGSEGLYATSGLVEDKSKGWKRKDAWYYLHTLKSIFKGQYLETKIEDGDQNLYAYKYTNDEGNINIYALWKGTFGDTSKVEFNLPLEFRGGNVYEVQLKSREIFGSHTPITATNNFAKVQIGEKPCFIIEYKKGVVGTTYYYDEHILLDSTNILTEEEGANQLVDEQRFVQDLIFNTSYTPTSVWHSNRKTGYPKEVNIVFDGVKNISWIGFYDKNRSGEMEIYHNDQLILGDSLNFRNRWIIHKTNFEAKSLKLKFYEFNARISEIVFFEQKKVKLHLH